MLLGEAQDNAKNDLETLHYEIDMAICEVLDESDIAIIDKSSRSRIVNTCLNNNSCKSGEYDSSYLKRIIKNELYDIGYRLKRSNHIRTRY